MLNAVDEETSLVSVVEAVAVAVTFVKFENTIRKRRDVGFLVLYGEGFIWLAVVLKVVVGSRGSGCVKYEGAVEFRGCQNSCL